MQSALPKQYHYPHLVSMIFSSGYVLTINKYEYCNSQEYIDIRKKCQFFSIFFCLLQNYQKLCPLFICPVHVINLVGEDPVRYKPATDNPGQPNEG